MMEGTVYLDGEEFDKIKLSMVRCPAQPERIRTMSGSRFPETACSAIIAPECGNHLGNVGSNGFWCLCCAAIGASTICLKVSPAICRVSDASPNTLSSTPTIIAALNLSAKSDGDTFDTTPACISSIITLRIRLARAGGAVQAIAPLEARAAAEQCRRGAVCENRMTFETVCKALDGAADLGSAGPAARGMRLADWSRALARIRPRPPHRSPPRGPYPAPAGHGERA